jgi:hypothetical protein
LLISSGIKPLPAHSSSTYSMSDNNLNGSQSGQATEHSATLSTFKINDTEIGDSLHLEFRVN